MLVVTTNPTLYAAVRKAGDLAQQHGVIRPARRMEKFEDLLEHQVDGFLVLDLAACLKYEPDFVADTVYAWRMLNPTAQVIMLYSSVGDYNQGVIMHGLGVKAGVRTMYPITKGLQADLWLDLLLSNPFLLLVTDMRAEFEAMCAQAGLQFPNQGLIHALLEYAPSEVTFEGTVEKIRLAGVKQLHVNRHWLWEKLRSAGQLPPNYFCTGFRLAAMLKMRQQTDWSAREIAKYLGYEDSRQMMLRQKSRTGFGQTQLSKVPYPVMLEFTVSLCLPKYATVEVPTFQALIEPFVTTHNLVGTP